MIDEIIREFYLTDYERKTISEHGNGEKPKDLLISSMYTYENK